MPEQASVPSAFFWRRMHSFMGLWLVLFLMEHLLTNSQAALWFENDGVGFVKSVNWIQSLPFLHVIEIFLLGVPFLIHMVWGVKYLRTGKSNIWSFNGARPSLPQYPRNHAYTWQRITSWILLFAIVLHVTQMRFMNYPSFAKLGHKNYYMAKVSLDPGLYTVAERLNVELYDQKAIHLLQLKWQENKDETKSSVGLFDKVFSFFVPGKKNQQAMDLLEKQKDLQRNEFLEALEQRQINDNEVIAVAPDFGTAELLVVRETFKMPMMLILYSFFVLSASFHAFNGLWTFLITWGVTLTQKSQNLMRKAAIFLMVLITALGFSAIWGTYLVTLRS